jgi:hypothetical protein
VVTEELGTIDTITDTHAGIKEVEAHIFFEEYTATVSFHFDCLGGVYAKILDKGPSQGY